MKPTSFKFDSKTTNLLDKLKNDTSAASRSEVIRKALRLLNAAHEAEKEKKELVIKDTKGGSEQKIILW